MIGGAAPLTREAFDRLLHRLDSDRERAGEKYELIRHKLIKFFDYRGCDTPEQAADETINRVARRIEEGEEIRAADAAAYFHGVARNVLREYWARPERRLRPLDEVPAAELARAGDVPSPDEEAEERWQCLERCLGQLTAGQRDLVTTYYAWGRGERIGNRRELCGKLGMTQNALRIRVHRIRLSLERCVAACACGKGAEMESAGSALNGEGMV
jgi:DNA-directed RNA polymerase specialized sigma24 family protein